MQHIPSYCMNFFCPWAPMYHLLDQLMIHTAEASTQNNNSSGCCYTHLTPLSAAHSCVTCIFPCGLTANSAARYVSEHEAQSHAENATVTSWLPHELSMFMPAAEEPEAEEEEATVSKTLSDYTLPAVCMGLACMLPSMCWLRHKVDATVHRFHKEPMWETGLITCLAWPCSLTQMLEEMDNFNSPVVYGDDGQAAV